MPRIKELTQSAKMELLKTLARDSDLTTEEVLELLWVDYIEPRVRGMESEQRDFELTVLRAGEAVKGQSFPSGPKPSESASEKAASPD
ncbi:MAG: hypothetical protein ABSH26_18150 [Opitutaceae bacterium]|jgi:hypothetical protein